MEQSEFSQAISPLEERQRAFAEWVERVRDPVDQAAEGVRRLIAGNRKAIAENQIAPPPSRTKTGLSKSFRRQTLAGPGTSRRPH